MTQHQLQPQLALSQRVIAASIHYWEASMAGPNIKTLTLTYSPSRELGLSPDDDTVGALVTTNPSNQWYGLVWMAETGSSTATSASVKVQMEYCVKFSQQKDIAGS